MEKDGLASLSHMQSFITKGKRNPLVYNKGFGSPYTPKGEKAATNSQEFQVKPEINSAKHFTKDLRTAHGLIV